MLAPRLIAPLLGVALASALLGIILGPMAEQYFLTSMVSHANDLTVFVARPVSAVVLACASFMVVWPFVRSTR